MFTGIGLYHESAFDPTRFMIRAVYLAMVAALLGYVGAYRQRLNNTLTKLAARPTVASREPQMFFQNRLARAADILQVPRVLIIWEEQEEPWIYLALWSPNEFYWKRQPPTMFDHLVADRLANRSFLCPDIRAPEPKILYSSSTGLHRWHGTPLHPDLQKQFAIGTVLSSSLRGAIFEGRLFFLDKSRFTPDDIVLADFVAQQVTADLDQFYFVQRQQQGAITEERLRLVRNLHDGLLQSLTGMALQLAETYRVLEENPSVAREHVLDVQRILADEQRDLRFLVSELKSTSFDAVEADLSLATRLEAVRRRIQRQWGLQVDLSMTLPGSPLPAKLSYDIYYIVHEALINAARHAHASAVQVELGIQNDQVHVTVVDNGRGFSFQGQYDLAALTYLKLGPMMLRERVASLGGTLTLDSTATGARLEILLPLTPQGRYGADMSPTG
jgi:signal transduction histidine kinase